MIYDRSDYLPKSEYVKVCKIPEGAVKLRGASYVFAHVTDEYSDFHKFGIGTAMVSTLVSYDTAICDWCADVLFLNVNAFGYSRTTCRHLAEFLKRYTPLDYATLKAVYDHYDPVIGQVVKIENVTVMFV